MSKKVVVKKDETKVEPVEKSEKLHIGNAKLSETKKAVRIHIFEGDQLFVIPLQEISLKKEIGRVYEYQGIQSEICGEIFKRDNNSEFYTMRIKESEYFIKTTYINLFLNNTNLTLPIYQE